MKILTVAILLGLLLSAIQGCALNPGESRKITAWGIWAAPMGLPVGIGYWHSERGPGGDIKSETSAKPELPKGLTP